MKPQPFFQPSMSRRLAFIAAFACVVAMLGVAPPSASAQSTSSGCTATGVAGGVEVSWPAVTGATTYVWALKVDGAPTRYNRVNATTTTITTPAGTTAQVLVSGVYSDGRYSGAVDCGTATAADGGATDGGDPGGGDTGGGAGGGDTDTACRISPQPEGLLISWGAGRTGSSPVIDQSNAIIGVSIDLSSSPATRYFQLSNNQGVTPDGAKYWGDVALPRGWSSFVDRVVLSERDGGGGLKPQQTCAIDAPVNQTGGCTFRYTDGRYVVTPDSLSASVTVQLRFEGAADEWAPAPDGQAPAGAAGVRSVDWLRGKYSLAQTIPRVCTAA